MTKTAMISGVAGFIGHNLVRGLSEKGYDVIGIDIEADKINTDFLEDLKRDFSFVKADCRQFDQIDHLIEMTDICYHLAAQTSVPYSIKYPFDNFQHNVIGSDNVMNSCMKHGVKMIFTSSFAVYGNPATTPIPETTELNPISPYGMSKMITERMITYYQKNYKLDATILRLSNIYGFMDYKSVIYHFLSKSLDNDTITVNGTGNTTRDFLFVNDVVDALLESAKMPNGIFNIGTGEATSLNQLLAILKEIGSTSTIQFNNGLKGDVKDSCADMTHTFKATKWRPRYSVEDGMRIFSSWLRDNIRG